MRILRKKDIIAEIQPDLGVSSEVIMKVVDSYWTEVGDSVRGLRSLSINIPKIGELRIVKRKLDFVEEYLIRKLKETSPGQKKDYYKYKLSRIKSLQEERDEEYKKREGVRQRRKEYEQTKESMEVKDKDSGSSVV